MRQRHPRHAAVVIALILSQGCALSLSQRPAHTVAPIGVQVSTAVEAAQDVIIGLADAGLIPHDQARKAVKATVDIGYAGRKLVAALRTLDSAQSAVIQARATGEVTALLDVINGLLFDAVAPFTDAGVRAQVAGLLREINTLLLAIAGAVVRVP